MKKLQTAKEKKERKNGNKKNPKSLFQQQLKLQEKQLQSFQTQKCVCNKGCSNCLKGKERLVRLNLKKLANLCWN